MADTSFDVVVIGSGPGGYVTAIRAAQLGFKTAIVEKAYLGGICNNWGCIPTKALLRSAEIYHYMKHAKDYGLSADNVSFDPKAVIARSRGVVKRLNGGVEYLMNKNKITIIWGEATLDGSGKFTVKKTEAAAPKGALGEGAYTAKHIIVATGARPRVLPGLEPDKKLVWTYFEAMNPDKNAEVAAGGRLRRHRHRVRVVLSHHGRGGDGGRGVAADSSCRRRGNRRGRAQTV